MDCQVRYLPIDCFRALKAGLTTCSRSTGSARLDLSCIQPHLCQVDESSPDVLLLYDSCHPANGQGSVESGRAVIELLAATGFESIAPEVGRDSFTNCLIQELSIAARKAKGISIPELHRRQICRIQSGQQESVVMGRDSEGRMRVRTNGTNAIFERSVRRTPVHCQLSLNDRPRAIVLSPLPDPRERTKQEFLDLGCSVKSDNPGEKESRESSELHALLRVSLVEDEFNETEFKDWLCGAPAAAKGIRILGVLPSCSTLLLIDVPIEVWDMLPPSPAISFIAFIRAHAGDEGVLSSTSPARQYPTTSVEYTMPMPEGTAAELEALATMAMERGELERAAVKGALSKPQRKRTRAVGFQHSKTEKAIVEILDIIDDILPGIFRQLQARGPGEKPDREAFVTAQVMDALAGSGDYLQPAWVVSLANDLLSNAEVGYISILNLVITLIHCLAE